MSTPKKISPTESRAKCRLARLVLNRVLGVGSPRILRLVEKLESVDQIFAMNAQDLMSIPGLSREEVSKIRSAQEMDAAKREEELAHDEGITIQIPEDATYPDSLRDLADPPSALYVRGDFEQTTRKVALVGTRRNSSEGRQNAVQLVRGLAKRGVEIISGLARGIDAIGHEAALSAGGRTLAVLGSGLLKVYPKEHEKLYQRICANGAICSEYGLNEEPKPWYFPYRNRLVSCLAQAVLVVQAPRKSGALITARTGAEQGRAVFVVPGSIQQKCYAGSNQLIRDGAICVTHVDEVLEYMGWNEAQDFFAMQVKRNQDPLLSLAVRYPRFEDIKRKSGLDTKVLLERLTVLELKGCLKKNGSRYRVAD